MEFTDDFVRGFMEKCAAENIDPEALVKQAWLYMLPMAGMGAPSEAAQVPLGVYHGIRGPQEPGDARWKSFGRAGLGALGLLMSLGFAKGGLKQLGQKLSVLGGKAGKFMGPPTREMAELAHKMDVPAYRRFAENWGKAKIPFTENAAEKTWREYAKSFMGTDVPMGGREFGRLGRWAGTAAGGIAHPFNKLEDITTSGLAKLLGPERASRYGGRLMTFADRNRLLNSLPVNLAMHPLMLPAMLAGGPLVEQKPVLPPGMRSYQDYAGRQQELGRYT